MEPGIWRGKLKLGHLENVQILSRAQPREEEKTAQPAGESVDGKRVDAIVVVHGLAETQRSLAAEPPLTPPGASEESL